MSKVSLDCRNKISLLSSGMHFCQKEGILLYLIESSGQDREFRKGFKDDEDVPFIFPFFEFHSAHKLWRVQCER